MSKEREEQRRKTQRARRNRQKGDETERWVASKFQEVPGWESVKRKMRVRYGPPQSDLEDDVTGWCTEVKNRASLPATLEGALEQAGEYAQTRVDGPIPLVVIVDSPGRGIPKHARVYYDFECWLEEQKERAELGGLIEVMAKAAGPLVDALQNAERSEVHEDDVNFFLDVFGPSEGRPQ